MIVVILLIQTMDYTSPHVSVIEVENSAEINQTDTPVETIAPERNHQEKTGESIKNIFNTFFQWVKRYIKKCSGLHENRPNRFSWDEHFWSFTGSLISIVLIAILHYRLFEK
jgi:hypothetical protein